jgi:transketolase
MKSTKSKSSATSTFPIDPNLLGKTPERIPNRDGYGQGVLEIATEDERVVVLTADVAESTRVLAFKKQFPKRFFECGVAEQNMMGIAAGLALSGHIPFVSSYATFSPGRSWDQLRVSVCYSNANVKVIGAHTGISVGPDGATHQALEDIALTRVLPGLVVLAPCDVHEARKATIAAAKYSGPVYLRLAREKTPVITTPDSPFEIGKAYVVRPGTDVTIVATGPLLAEALFAAEVLAKKQIQAEIINCPTIKPLDDTTLLESFKKTGCAVTVEEHQITGGLFGAIAELTSRTHPIPLEPVGMPNVFGESGEPAELLAAYDMDQTAILAAVKRLFRRI